MRVVVNLSLVLVLAAQMPGAYSQQSFPHDPELLSKIQRRNFAEIERGERGAVDLLAVIEGFKAARCSGQGKLGGTPEEAMQMTTGLVREAGTAGALSSLMIAASPNYQRVVALVAAQGCNSNAVQSTIGNMVALLRERYVSGQGTEGDRGRTQRDARREAALTDAKVIPISGSNLASRKNDSVSFPEFYRFQNESWARVWACTYQSDDATSRRSGAPTIYFWSQKIWHTRKELQALHPEHPFLDIPEVVVKECPPTRSAAQALLPR